MSKELEAINKLFVLSSEYHQKLWCLKLAPVYPEERERYIDRIVKRLPNDAGELNDLYNYIKQALIQKAKQEKILDILKNKLYLELDSDWLCLKRYKWQEADYTILSFDTQEEYDLLKEWLKND